MKAFCKSPIDVMIVTSEETISVPELIVNLGTLMVTDYSEVDYVARRLHNPAGLMIELC